MPFPSVPGPRPAPQPGPPRLEPPRPEEVHVLLLGLDGLAAALAVLLLRCGVLGLNVNDGSPVAAADLDAGVYRPADLGRPRDEVLRRRLRALDPRCVPVSAPELFPGALLPGTVVVRSTEHPLAGGGGALWTEPALDPRHPLVSLHHADGALLRWPTVPWAHRPCPDCLRATLGAREPDPVPRGPGAVLTGWARPAHAEAVAGGLAVEVLAVALAALWGDAVRGAGVPAEPRGTLEGTDGGPHARLLAPPWPGAEALLELDRSLCLCGLGQA
ncbi:ThiF family adenylyltransferase [Kocuria turfanensis]|uniref:ThiF family adenylyltransferase n=1 Tax=Kocuria turfanensis TaxID=388357 RepID=UPI004035D9EA